MPSNAIPQAHLDRLARSRGFPDYATWAAWQAHQSQGLRQPVQQKPVGNILQYLGALYPPTIFNHVSKALGDATGQ